MANGPSFGGQRDEVREAATGQARSLLLGSPGASLGDKQAEVAMVSDASDPIDEAVPRPLEAPPRGAGKEKEQEADVFDSGLGFVSSA